MPVSYTHLDVYKRQVPQQSTQAGQVVVDSVCKQHGVLHFILDVDEITLQMAVDETEYFGRTVDVQNVLSVRSFGGRRAVGLSLIHI